MLLISCWEKKYINTITKNVLKKFINIFLKHKSLNLQSYENKNYKNTKISLIALKQRQGSYLQQAQCFRILFQQKLLFCAPPENIKISQIF